MASPLSKPLTNKVLYIKTVILELCSSCAFGIPCEQPVLRY